MQVGGLVLIMIVGIVIFTAGAVIYTRTTSSEQPHVHAFGENTMDIGFGIVALGLLAELIHYFVS